VEIESDLGDRLALATGIDEGALVAINPSEHLLEGMHVESQEMGFDGSPKKAADAGALSPSAPFVAAPQKIDR
jgi:hypothetical protein